MLRIKDDRIQLKRNFIELKMFINEKKLRMFVSTSTV